MKLRVNRKSKLLNQNFVFLLVFTSLLYLIAGCRTPHANGNNPDFNTWVNFDPVFLNDEVFICSPVINSKNRLLVVDLQSLSFKPLLANREIDAAEASISSDGRHVTFIIYDRARRTTNIGICDIDGSDVSQVTDFETGYFVHGPRFSSNMSEIYFNKFAHDYALNLSDRSIRELPGSGTGFFFSTHYSRSGALEYVWADIDLVGDFNGKFSNRNNLFRKPELEGNFEEVFDFRFMATTDVQIDQGSVVGFGNAYSINAPHQKIVDKSWFVANIAEGTIKVVPSDREYLFGHIKCFPDLTKVLVYGEERNDQMTIFDLTGSTEEKILIPVDSLRAVYSSY